MSAADITDEMIEQGREAREEHYLRVSPVSCTCGWRSDTYIEADGLPRFEAHLVELALEAAAPLIAAQALEAARGPYRCCPHCADDIIHDVEKDDHTVPCQICQNDEIRRAKAEAWEEGHAAGCADPYAKYGECGCGPNPYRADQVEQGGQP